MSINNRKYIQSTGSLLTRLAEESNNPNYNQHQRDTMMQQQMLNSKPQSSFQPNVNMNNYNRTQQQQQQQMPYQNYQQTMPQYSTSNNIYVQQQAQSNVQMFTPANLQPVAAAAQLLNQISNSKQETMYNQRRHQQHHGSYNTSRDSKKPHQKKQQQQKQAAPVSSSSVTELPETFGLPSNHKKYATKPSLQVDTSSDEAKTPVNGETRLSNVDIEIIGEANCPDSNLIVTTTSAAPPIQSKQSSDELFKSYLGRKFKGQLSVTSKPQSNFISNFSCISQILAECDYYTQRQRRPYSNLKLRNVFTNNDSEGDESDAEDDESQRVKKKLKTTHVIVIDDTNEEMHKPWITDDLIKLIKHRNMLQAKLGEKNDGGSEPDEELVKKFKNLRNKVTKLVKKARKDYLAKYIADSKEMKKIESEKQVLEPSLAVSLSQQAPPPPPNTAQVSTEATTTASTKQASPSKPLAEDPVVDKITAQLISSKKETDEVKTSFLKSQNTLMMGLYKTYYSQYIQQYQSQQEEAHKLTQAAAEHEKKVSSGEVEADEATKSSFELLQKQAAYYAKQQASIQSQLEASLSQSAHQLIQEISQMASAQAQKPFVLNQFTHQQQHHHHQHIHPNTGYSQPISAVLASYDPAQQQQQQIPTQQQSSGYNMHYSYNMVVS